MRASNTHHSVNILIREVSIILTQLNTNIEFCSPYPGLPFYEITKSVSETRKIGIQWLIYHHLSQTQDLGKAQIQAL